MNPLDVIAGGIGKALFGDKGLTGTVIDTLKDAGILKDREGEERARAALMAQEERAEQRGVELFKAEVLDRDSARQRERDVKDKTPATLAFIIVGAFISVAIFVVAHPYIFPSTKIEPEMLGMVGTVIGYLSAKAEQVASYYFGSSAGSQAKDATIGHFVRNS